MALIYPFLIKKKLNTNSVFTLLVFMVISKNVRRLLFYDKNINIEVKIFRTETYVLCRKCNKIVARQKVDQSSIFNFYLPFRCKCEINVLPDTWKDFCLKFNLFQSTNNGNCRAVARGGWV